MWGNPVFRLGPRGRTFAVWGVDADECRRRPALIGYVALVCVHDSPDGGSVMRSTIGVREDVSGMSTMSHLPQGRVHRPRVNLWLLAVVALAAALVGLGAWVIVDHTASSSSVSVENPTQDLASPAIVTMLRNRLAALNRADAKAQSAFYTQDAVLNDVLSGTPSHPQPLVSGNEAIGSYNAGLVKTYGFQIESVPPIIQHGRTVLETAKVFGDKEPSLLLVYRLALNGRISYEWVLPAGTDVTAFG
jgi:hypothetical protein